jgi:hypothetical protein
MSEIVVRQRLRHLVHRIEHAQLFTEHEQLDRHIRGLLRAKGASSSALSSSFLSLPIIFG